MMLLTLRGTPVLYQGDEIGLGDVAVAREQLRDPLGVKYWPALRGPRRDAHTDALARHGPEAASPSPASLRGSRSVTPPATSSISAPIPARCSRSLAISSRCEGSTSSYVPAPTRRAARRMACGCGARGSRFVVALNLSESDAHLDDMTGRIRIATDRARDGEALSGSLRLRAWEGVVVER